MKNQNNSKRVIDLIPNVYFNSINIIDAFHLIHNADKLSITADAYYEDKIDKLDLSVRSYNALRRGGIVTIYELLQLPCFELFKINSIGKHSASEILELAYQYFVNSYHRANNRSIHPIKLAIHNYWSPKEEAYFDILDDDVIVLTPEYGVYKGSIYHRSSLTRIEDEEIGVLDLNQRSYNALRRSKYNKISDLINLPFWKFMGINNIGKTSRNNITENLDSYLERELKLALTFNKNKTEYSHQKFLEEQLQNNIEKEKKRILNCYKGNEFVTLSFDELVWKLQKEEQPESLKVDLQELIEQELLIEKNGAYKLKYISVFEQLDAWKKEYASKERKIRMFDVLTHRFSGLTLEETAKISGDVTRERIRQIEKSAKEFIEKSSLIFKEDRYKYLFETYYLKKEFYLDYLKLPILVFGYLKHMFEVGSKNPEEALDDNLLSTNIRRKIEKFLYKNHVRVENDLIPLNRADIENYLLKKYCRDTTSFDDFVEIYNKFIFENHLQENKNLLYTDDVMRTRLNRLAESDLVLWKTFKRMRYYNIEAQDYTELLETLNLEQYENIHLSTMKFMMEFPDIMKHYDIRDEYELHNLLKKIKADQNIKSMEFGRMPTLKFGDFDINTFVKEKLFELSPISTDDLADEISNELGYLVDTIKANWFNNIKEYYHNGVYETDVISLPDSHFEILVNNLEADFHYIKDIKKLYENLIENADISLISSYNLKKMGFICNSGYVIKNYSSAEAYFRSILLKEDVFDITQINNKYRYLTTYSALLTKVRNSFDIIEFEPNQYINIRRLNELNIYPKDLIEFSNQVYEYVENEEFFTMEMIRNRGFNSKLDFLGFNELFYKSLIKSDERFTYQNVGGNTVFSRNNDQFVTIDLIVNILIEEISIHVEDMIHLLAQDYNIILKREKIITMVNESELYYDRITEKIYLNYSVYFEEI